MSPNTTNSSIPLDALTQTVGIFAVVGAGLGLAGSVAISQFGSGSGIFGGIMILLILTTAFLLAPVIGVMTGLRTGDLRGQTSESYLVGLIGSLAGYYVMMIMVMVFVGVAIAIVTGDSGSGSTAAQSGATTTTSTSGDGFSIGEYIVPIVAISIPTGLSGLGGVYFGKSGQDTTESVSTDTLSVDLPWKSGQDTTESVSTDILSVDLPWKYIGIGALAIIVLIAGIVFVPSLLQSPLEVTGDSDTTSNSLWATGSVVNPNNGEITTTVTVETIINNEAVATEEEQIIVPANGEIGLRIRAVAASELSRSQLESIRNDNYQLRYIIDGQTVETYEP